MTEFANYLSEYEIPGCGQVKVWNSGSINPRKRDRKDYDDLYRGKADPSASKLM
jgi:hypothetical protein